MKKINRIIDASRVMDQSLASLSGSKVSIVSKPVAVVTWSMMSVPKWVFYAIGAATVFLGAILGASIIVIGQAPRAAQYLENCKGRSCQSGLNLKCLNNTCNCLRNQYYSKGCINKKSNDEDCTFNFECDSSLKLYCYNGKCQCNATQYFDTQLGYCFARKNYSQKCEIDNNCFTSQMIECISGFCQCNSKRFWNGRACLMKRTLGERCSSNNDCNDAHLLTCRSGVCNCNTTWEYFDDTAKICKEKLGENQVCTLTKQCLGQMTCITSGICSCAQYNYFELFNLTCIPQVKVNKSCSIDIHCRVDLSLTCQSNKCLCDNQTQTWYNDTRGCINYIEYGQTSCLNSAHCKPGLGLTCNLIASSNQCNCPISSVNSMCDCIRVDGSEWYWNGTVCEQAKNEFETCAFSYECLRPMYCNATSTTCLCPFTQYYQASSYSCKNKSLNGGWCSSNWHCRDDLGLYCSASVCKCDTSIKFWHATNLVCTNYYAYGEVGCTANGHCEPGHSLICNTNSASNQCVCPITSINNMCDCMKVSGAEFYWNSTNCVLAKNEFASCLNDYECLEPMSCVLNKCECPTNKYFSLSLCPDKLMHGVSCNRDQMCRTDLGLSCLAGACLCDITRQFWDATSTMCKNYYNYSNVGCVSDAQCFPGTSLLCNLNPTSNQCSCPTMSQTAMCDCRKISGNEQYWDGARCVSAKSYGQSCSNTYECQLITKGLECIASKCDCMNEWKHLNGKCYRVYSPNGACTSSNADTCRNFIKDKCSSAYFRSRLAIVSTSVIFNFIKSTFPSSFVNSFIGGFWDWSGSCSCGLFCTTGCNWSCASWFNDCNFFGWKWIDGSPMATSANTGSWCPGSSGYYSASGDAFCVSMALNCFQNTDCNNNFNFACEYSVL